MSLRSTVYVCTLCLSLAIAAPGRSPSPGALRGVPLREPPPGEGGVDSGAGRSGAAADLRVPPGGSGARSRSVLEGRLWGYLRLQEVPVVVVPASETGVRWPPARRELQRLYGVTLPSR